MLLPQEPKDICVFAGFCPAMKKSVPMLKLHAAKTVSGVESIPALKTIPALKSIPALQLVPATKVESSDEKSARVRHRWHSTADSSGGKNACCVQLSPLVPARNICLVVLQPVVRVRESPGCAICEFVMKQLESMLENESTEVGYVPPDV